MIFSPTHLRRSKGQNKLQSVGRNSKKKLIVIVLSEKNCFCFLTFCKSFFFSSLTLERFFEGPFRYLNKIQITE